MAGALVSETIFPKTEGRSLELRSGQASDGAPPPISKELPRAVSS